MGLTTADARKLELDHLASLVDDKWREFVKRAMPFHAYSFSNICLILCQRPDATRVAGFRQWQQRNRYVKKGSKAVWIYAPMLVKDPAEEDGKILRFKTVPVFCFEDTEGDNDSDFIYQELTADSTLASSEAYAALRRAVTSDGVRILDDQQMDAAGSYRRSSREIRLSAGLTPVQQLSVLLHETAHHLQHQLQERDDSYDANELSAEIAACKALARVGIDGTDSSFGYVYSWNNGEPDMLRRELGRADKLANVLIDWCHPAEALTQQEAA